MMQLSLKPTRVVLASLLLVLILSTAFTGVQLLAANQALAQAPNLATSQEIAAIQGGEQLLLSASSGATIYLPLIIK